MLRVDGAVENGEEMDRVLAGLARDFGAKAGLLPLRQAVRAAATPVLRDLERSTPVRTGSLRASARLVVSANKRGQGRKPTAYALIGWRPKRGGRARREQALAIEFGARGAPARRVLDRLFRRNADRMRRVLTKEIPLAVERQFKKLGRQNGFRVGP